MFAVRVVAAASVGGLLLAVAACGGSSSPNANTKGTNGGTPAKGGTLYLLNYDAFPHLDPERIYPNRAETFTSRTFIRTLTTFASGDGHLVGDVATSTGTSSDSDKTWTFHLKSGVMWQDGKPVTCADFQYGISRTFATQQLGASGPLYMMADLDIPKKSDGATSVYAGPYTGTGQQYYDKAVQCPNQQTIVFHLSHPVADFNSVVALPGEGAVRKDKDTGTKYDFTLFSDGPYMLKGTWSTETGGTLVRNPYWKQSTDSVRKAYPDEISVTQGINTQTLSQRLVANSGKDQDAYTNTSVDPSVISQILGNPSVKARADNDTSGFVDYLAVNAKHIPNQMEREALVLATNQNAYIAAMGGSTYGTPATSIMSPQVNGWKKFNPFGTVPGGDIAKAKSLLQQAGVSSPTVSFGYPTSTTMDKAASVLAQGWKQAGFSVKIIPENADNYYDTAANPKTTPDITWSSWVADWPSGSTDIPALFDGRRNLSPSSDGADWGELNDPKINAAIDKVSSMTSLSQQNQGWGDLDEMVVKTAAVIPLTYQKYFYLHGSNVHGITYTFGGFPDIATAWVDH
jgi:peptide/nickel transport system substrate-binding protein